MQNLSIKTLLIGTGRLSLLCAALLGSPAFSDDTMPQEPQETPAPQETQAPQETPAPQEIQAPQEQEQSANAPDLSESVNSNPNVVRAVLTTAISDREPTDEVQSINKDQGRIYFFTELSGLKGKVIRHRWEYQGKVMAEVSINVGSSQWRCYSSKNLLPEWTGSWTVSAIDDQDQVLVERHFEVTE